MPAVGILKKPSEAIVQRPRPPPPPPPQATKNGKPVIPPKPKRGIPPPGHAATPVGDGEKLRDVRFADEEEPTTEDSYDYKDLDFASDIFEFRPPPPRPRPPHPKPLLHQQSNGDARPTGFTEKSTPLQTEDNVRSDLENEDDRMMSLEAEDLPRDDGERPMDEDDDDDDDDESDGKVDDLAIFLQEHEGKELTVEDVRQLERLLDAAEKAEAGVEEDDKDSKDIPVSDATEDRERMPAVRFGTAEFLDDGLLENADEEEMEEEELAEPVEAATEEPRSDYNSTVEFQRQRIGVKGRQTSVDSGTYEPVGPPDLRFVRPDLSGYVPPQPSPRIGDPFSWRRRGKRRLDRYGYETTPFGGIKGAPALSRILDGCQKLELFIASRHLGPPGMLLNTLGGDRRRKRKMKEPAIRPPPRRPPPPVPPKINMSTLPSLPNESISPSPPGDDVVEESPVGDDQEVRMALEAELEKQIWVEHAHKDTPTVETTIQIGNASSDESQTQTVSDSTTLHIVEIEPVVTKVEAYQTGDCEKSAEKVNNSECKAKYTEVEDSVQKSKGTEEGSVQKSPGAEEISIQRNSEEIDRPKRASRKDVTSGSQRPWQVPCRPERRKRVASAEPPLTAFGLEREQEQEQELGRAPPRRKPKRSASFHTAEEIRRKIDAQAQYFLRTPRRKERSSTEYLAAYPSASASLTYGTLRRKGRALTPVYSHVDKSALRRKEAAVQAPTRVNSFEKSEEGQEENQSSTLQIPDSPPKISEVECKIDEKPEDDEQVESKEDKLDITSESVQSDQTEVPKDLQRSNVQEEGEDSKVPSEFHNLKSSPEQDVDTNSSSPATRPLPPPPAPPRRKHAATTLSKELLAAGNSPVVFCGIFPQDDSSLSGKVTVIPRMKVMELSVVRLEASHLRVSQLDADHLTVARTTLENRQETPLPPKPQGGGESGENGSRPVDKGQKGYSSEDQQEFPPKNSEDSSNKEAPQGPPSDDGSTKTETIIAGVPATNGPVFPEAGGDGWPSFDPVEDRTGCESPLGTVTSTTSGSASYVTCDETLHLDDVESDLGLINGLELSDTDIGEDFVSELEDDDDGTGCRTPTEHEAPSIPDAFLSSTAPSYLSSFLALSPSASLPSSDISFSSPDPISRNAAPAEMDENFNLWNPEFKNVVHHVSHSQGTDDISLPVPSPDQDHEAASGEPPDIPKVGNPHENSCQKPDESG